jgi:hypothetical protein
VRPRLIIALAALLATPLLTNAAQRPRPNITVASGDQVFTHIADGDQWTTSFTLINIDTSPANYTLSFYDDNGNPLSLGISGLGTATDISGTLPVNGSVVYQTTGGVGVLQGWAYLAYDHVIAGTAVFTRRLPGNAVDFEAAVPLESQFQDRFVIAFDNAGGYYTGIALVNASSGRTETVSVTFRDETGAAFLLDSFVMGPNTHTAFLVDDTYPATAGVRGVVEFSTNDSAAQLAGLGLRFNPTGSFTSTSPFSAVGW